VSRKSSSCGARTLGCSIALARGARTRVCSIALVRGARTRVCSIALVRGARTRACRVGQEHPPKALLIARQGRPSWMPVVNTRVNARACAHLNPELGICTRPFIILDLRNQPRLHRIPLDIPRNATPLLLITNPMIVRLPLPELLAGAAQQSIGLTRGRSFERFQELGRRNRRAQEHVNVVCHDYEGPRLVIAELDSAVQGVYNELRDARLSQELGAGPRVIEIAVNPSERFTRSGLGGWWESAGGKTSVQGPGNEQPAVLRVGVGKAAGVHESLVALRAIKSQRSHECERGTQECVRHVKRSVRYAI
jgi:hypothetical protein